MEAILNTQITVSMIVGVMAKIMMLLLLVLALVMVRQAALMGRVVNLPIGGNLKLLSWSFFALLLLLTVIVVLA